MYSAAHYKRYFEMIGSESFPCELFTGILRMVANNLPVVTGYDLTRGIAEGAAGE